MSRIIIQEQDLTTSGAAEYQGTDVVYVPGFSSLLVGGAEANTPTLCYTVRDFERYFGTTPAQFASDQSYPSDFSSDSKPGTVMFKAGDADPSYIYAKELLSAGIPVIYERLNISLLDITVAYFYSAVTQIFEKTPRIVSVSSTLDGDKYIRFKPSACNIVKFSTIYPDEGVYNFLYRKYENYVQNVATTTYAWFDNTSATLVTEQPTNWSTEQGNYYSKMLKESKAASESAAAFTAIKYTPVKGFYTVQVGSTTTKYDVRISIPGSATYTYGYVGINNKIYTDASFQTEYTSLTADTVTYCISDNVYVKNTASGNTWAQNTYYTLGNIITFNVETNGLVTEDSGNLTDADKLDAILTMNYTYDEPALSNKGDYQFKYLTTGGYPTFEYNTKELAQSMADLAEMRGDCVALIDHTDYPGRALTGTTSVYNKVISQTYQLKASSQSFAAMFTPWASFALTASYGTLAINTCVLPGSFAYLKALSESIVSNPNWYAIAGAARGKVPSISVLHTDKQLTNAIADSYQSDYATSINPITTVTPYGLCIWGNRTLTSNFDGPTALSYLNIRNLVSDIKKQLYAACKKLLFEQNSTILWANFLSLVTPLLDRMKSGSGISDYRITKIATTQKASIKAVVTIYPMYAVESFDLTVILQDSDSTVEE